MCATGGQHNDTESPTVEVGEIDTRAPFPSVKDAITFFEKGAVSGEKTAFDKTMQSSSAERSLIAKESQFHLSQLKEEIKLKQPLNLEKESDPELAKTHIVSDIKCPQKQTERAGNSDSVREMTLDLNAEIVETQVLEKHEVKRTVVDDRMQDLEVARKRHAIMFAHFAPDAVKPLQDAHHRSKQIEVKKPTVASEKATEITVKNPKVQKSVQPSVIEHLRVRKELQNSLFIENLERQCEDELLNLQKQSQKQQNEVHGDVNCPQKQMERPRNQYVDPARESTSEFSAATESLNLEDLRRLLQYAEYKRQDALAKLSAKHMKSIQKLEILLADAEADRRFLELKLETIKQENSELSDKVIEAEFIRGKLAVKLRQTVSELKAARSREAKGRYSYVKMMNSKLQQISLEVELARKEQNRIAEDLKKEAAVAGAKIASEKVENKVKAETKASPRHSIGKKLSKAVNAPAFRKFIRVCRMGVAVWNCLASLN